MGTEEQSPRPRGDQRALDVTTRKTGSRESSRSDNGGVACASTGSLQLRSGEKTAVHTRVTQRDHLGVLSTGQVTDGDVLDQKRQNMGTPDSSSLCIFDKRKKKIHKLKYAVSHIPLQNHSLDCSPQACNLGVLPESQKVSTSVSMLYTICMYAHVCVCVCVCVYRYR